MPAARQSRRLFLVEFLFIFPRKEAGMKESETAAQGLDSFDRSMRLSTLRKLAASEPAFPACGENVNLHLHSFYSYNAAESYGLAIAILSDRLRGGPGIQTPWPTDDPPLSRAERRELQQHLARRGYDVGEPDGKIGQKTRDAIKTVEQQIGMPPTGRPGGKILQALRGR